MSTCLDPSFRLGCGPSDIMAAMRRERRRAYMRNLMRRIRAIEPPENKDYAAAYYHHWQTKKCNSNHKKKLTLRP